MRKCKGCCCGCGRTPTAEMPRSIGRNRVSGQLHATLPIRLLRAHNGSATIAFVGPGDKPASFVLQVGELADISLPITVNA